MAAAALTDLTELASTYCRNPDMELEAQFRLTGPDDFARLLERLSMRTHAPKQRLDIAVGKRRFSLESEAAIKSYIASNHVEDYSDIRVAIKQPWGKFVPVGGEYMVTLKVERPIRTDPRLIFDVGVPPSTRNYRIMKRWSLDRQDYRIDASVVRNASALSTVKLGALPRSQFSETFEVEVEFTGGRTGPEAVVRALNLGIEEVAAALRAARLESAPSASRNEERGVAAEYATLVQMPANRGLVGPNPVTLTRINLLKPDVDVVSILEGYVVTEKADGVRASLFVASDGAVYVAERSSSAAPRFEKFAETIHRDLALSVLDGELVETGSFLAFDVYYSCGRATSGRGLEARILEMARFEAVPRVTAKRYLPVDRACELAKGVANGAFRHGVDGLIFMPVALPVGAQYPGERPKLVGSRDRVCKWKPPEHNSIDFLVEVDEERAIALLYLDWSPDLRRIPPLEFYAGRDTSGAGMTRRLFEPMPTANLTYSDSVGAFVCRNGDRIVSGSVVEFTLVDDEFSAARVRRDKSKGNFYAVAMNVWNSMRMPVTLAHVCLDEPVTDAKDALLDARYWLRDQPRGGRTDLMMPMRGFHYWVKAFLFNKSEKHSALLDLGCGQGGDLSRWRAAGFDRVLGLDLYDDSITNGTSGVLARIGSHASQPAYFFARYDASRPLTKESIETLPDADAEWKKVLLGVFGYEGGMEVPPEARFEPVRGFETVSCMFALHYFFETPAKLRGFVDNVAVSLREDGLFVGCCFDRRLVLDALKRAGGREVVGRGANGRVLWMVEARDADAIDVYVASINRKITEYLVDFDALVRELSARGIDLEDTGLFEDLYSRYKGERMDDASREFSFMNRYFVFRRARG